MFFNYSTAFLYTQIYTTDITVYNNYKLLETSLKILI